MVITTQALAHDVIRVFRVYRNIRILRIGIIRILLFITRLYGIIIQISKSILNSLSDYGLEIFISNSNWNNRDVFQKTFR